VYCVLTFDPAAFGDRWEAYREGGKCWNNSLREAFRRSVGAVDYLQTWESTRRGWPHLNLILSGDRLREAVEAEGVERRRHVGKGNAGARWCLFPKGWRRWLRDAAVRAGFGPVAWAEILAPGSADAMAGYLVKLAQELTGAPAKKGDQTPIQAPRHFRRIRASRGLLPTAPKGSGEWTGALATGRLVREPSPARKPKQRREQVAATWEDVDALQRRLRAEAHAIAAQWGTDDNVQVLRESVSDGSQFRESPTPIAPRQSDGDVDG